LRAKLEMLAAGAFDLITLTTGLNIVNKEGRIRATFRRIEDGLGLALWTEKGETALSISCGDQGARVSFNDANGKIRMDVKLDGSGDPVLSLNDDSGEPRLTASVLSGVPRIMFHEGEELRLAICADPLPSMEVYDMNGLTRMRSGLGQADSPALVLYDVNEQARIALTVDEEGGPAIVFYDEFQSIVGMINEAALDLIGLHARQHRRGTENG
jgi:hypothetical protein